MAGLGYQYTFNVPAVDAFGVAAVPSAEIDSTLVKVAANINAGMIYSAEIDALLKKVAANLNVFIPQDEVTIGSSLSRVSASLNLYMRPDATITSTLRPVSASLNVSQRHLVTIASVLVAVLAAMRVRQLAVQASQPPGPGAGRSTTRRFRGGRGW